MLQKALLQANLDGRNSCNYCGEDICRVLVSLPCKSSHMVTLFVVGLDFGHIWTLKPAVRQEQ
jgi:hypothetical protein